jgi:hypothetical protein
MKSTLAILALAGSHFASGAITVQSYSHTPAPSSSYPDSGTQELTDGIANVPTWGGGNTITSGDIGPFVGWLFTDASTTFTFDNSYTVGRVTVWAADSDGAAGVGLPLTITLTDPNSSFTQTFPVTNPVGAGYMLPIVLDGFSVNTNQLQVSFTRGQAWTMLSEVSFETVPEPSSGIMMAVTSLFVFRRKR